MFNPGDAGFQYRFYIKHIFDPSDTGFKYRFYFRHIFAPNDTGPKTLFYFRHSFDPSDTGPKHRLDSGDTGSKHRVSQRIFDHGDTGTKHRFLWHCSRVLRCIGSYCHEDERHWSAVGALRMDSALHGEGEHRSCVGSLCP